MSLIHITSPSGVQSQYDLAQLRSMWEQGLLQEGTQYWLEGMPDWKPLSELFQVENASAFQSSSYSYIKDPRRLTSFLLIMLWVSLGIAAVAVLSDFGSFLLLNRSFTESELDANKTRQDLVILAVVGSGLIKSVLLLMWIYRANLNCRGFGAQDMLFTPGWSVGYFFIPLLNLFRPYQVVKEIWRVSHSPSDWKAQPAGAIVAWWWVLCIISTALGQLASGASMDTIEKARVAMMFSMFSGVVSAIYYTVTIKLVKTIASRQESLVRPA